MTIYQLMILKATEKKGISASLLSHFLDRCSCSQEQWDEIVTNKLVVCEQSRWTITDAGKKTLSVEKKGPNRFYF